MKKRFIFKGLLLASLALMACDDSTPSEAVDPGVVNLRFMDTGVSPGLGGGNGGNGGTPAICSGKYEAAGLYAAGVMEFEMDGVPVSVWYPAERASVSGVERMTYDLRDWLPEATAALIPDDESPVFTTNAYRDVPVADGAFPVVLFSHGLAGYRYQNSFMMDHLASWGFIVVSPESPERNLKTVLETMTIAGDNAAQALRDSLALLETANAAGGRLEGHVDLTKVATAGHSQGTSAASLVAADESISAWVTLAGAGFGNGPQKPLLVLGGTNDSLATPETSKGSFDAQSAYPRHYVSIEGAGHLGFTDICVIGRERGGVFQIAMEYGLDVPPVVVQLATDGCEEDDLPAEDGFPIINHYVVSHLKYAFGFDVDRAQFSLETKGCFGERIAAFESVWNGTPIGQPDDPMGMGGASGNGGEPGAGGSLGSGAAPGDGGSTGAGNEMGEGGESGEGGASGAGGDPDAGGEPAAGGDSSPVDPSPVDPEVDRLECVGASGRGPICDTSTQTCCAGFNPEGECLDGVDNDCSSIGFSAPAHCNGPEDCSDGQVCCSGFPTGQFCRDECGQPQGAWSAEVELCHDVDDCAGGMQCVACQPPGGMGPISTLCGEGCPAGWAAQ